MSSSTTTSTSSPPPIPLSRLSELTHEICTTVFPPTTTRYNHALTSSQNTEIINTLLQKILSETSSSSSTEEAKNYKWLVQSTIIQQNPVMEDGQEGEEGREGAVKRGMHSASGAYWNNERDGMWSCKWNGEGEEGGEEGMGAGAGGRGFDVVVSVVWVSVV